MSKYYANMTITYMENGEYKSVSVGNEVPKYVLDAWGKNKKGSETELDIRLRQKHIVTDMKKLDDFVVNVMPSEKEDILAKASNNATNQTNVKGTDKTSNVKKKDSKENDKNNDNADTNNDDNDNKDGDDDTDNKDENKNDAEGGGQ